MFKLRHFTDTWQILHYLKFLSSTVSIFPHPYGLVLSFFPFSNNGSESDVLDELLTFWLSVVVLWRLGSVFAVILQVITSQHFYRFHFAVTQNHFLFLHMSLPLSGKHQILSSSSFFLFASLHKEISASCFCYTSFNGRTSAGTSHLRGV